MNAFANRHVSAAIARLPAQSSAAVATVRASALSHRLASLVAACDTELARRPFAFTGTAAADFVAQEQGVAGMSLTDAIRYAFTVARPATPAETGFLRWLAENPGGSFTAAKAAYGKGDLSLVIGHLANHRHGCLRSYQDPADPQANVLLTVDRAGKGVRYWLKPEAEAVFRELGIVA